jgi:shikimate dehydrogenase
VQQACPGCAIDLIDEPGKHYDIAINGTSLGMQANDALPMSDDQILRSKLIAECVIAPEMTALLLRARALGLAIHTGVPMLEAQIDLMLHFIGIPLNP